MVDDVARDIFMNMVTFMDAHGGDYYEWFAGITDDYERRSHEHRIEPDVAAIVQHAGDNESARYIVEHLQELGVEGTDLNDHRATIVYLYKRKPGETFEAGFGDLGLTA